MPRVCRVCSQPDEERAAIDMALLTHTLPLRHITARWGISPRGLQRHEKDHLRSSLAQSKEARMALSVDTQLDRLSHLSEATLEMLAEARLAGELRTALIAIRESRGNVETFANIAEKTDVVKQLAEIQEELAEVRERLDHEQGEG
jgi:hypothetical protein